MPLPKMTRPTSVSDREDRELVGRCLNGESEAWEALIQRHRRLIYSVPVSFRLQRADADEVFQRTVIKLLDHLAQLRERGALPGWLKSVARRECLDLKRRSRVSRSRRINRRSTIGWNSSSETTWRPWRWPAWPSLAARCCRCCTSNSRLPGTRRSRAGWVDRSAHWGRLAGGVSTGFVASFSDSGIKGQVDERQRDD